MTEKFEVRTFPTMLRGNPVNFNYAQWLHPLEGQKSFPQHMIDFFAQRIPVGAHVLDIGAHTGQLSVIMGLCAGPEGIVMAFEPNPHVYRILATNAVMNWQLMRIYTMQLAVMPVRGQFTFKYTDEGYCNGGFRDASIGIQDSLAAPLQVWSVGIEEALWSFGPFDFIKIDTEGLDLEILSAIPRGYLLSQRPTLLVEVYPHMPRTRKEAILDLLWKSDYEIYDTQGDYVVAGWVEAGGKLAEGICTSSVVHDLLCVPTKDMMI